jgi:membrane-associated phospholipid phosphatase
VHYPSDVVAGALLGTACACIAAPLLSTRRPAMRQMVKSDA